MTGNTRVATMGGGNSRGQELLIDEKKHGRDAAAECWISASTPRLWGRLKNARWELPLRRGALSRRIIRSYLIRSKSILPAPSYTNAHQNAILYRTFRMTDMYTP